MKPRLPLPTLVLAAIAIGVHLLPPAATATLQFERTALAAGEWWRLVTGHLTHFDTNHLAWDVGALIVLGTICESASRVRTALALGVASLTISATVWMFQPQFETYRGLSGLDSALFGLFASTLIQQWRRESVIVGAVALLGVLAKSVFEITTGTTAFASGVGYAPVPLAHLVGMLSGITVAIGHAGSTRTDSNAEDAKCGSCRNRWNECGLDRSRSRNRSSFSPE
ncbi:MAG: rhombosortase [Opitutaceae bacterium]